MFNSVTPDEGEGSWTGADLETPTLDLSVRLHEQQRKYQLLLQMCPASFVSTHVAVAQTGDVTSHIHDVVRNMTMHK